jgi:hypothetical protein
MNRALERLICDAAGELFSGLRAPVSRATDLAPTTSSRGVDPLLTGSVVQARCLEVDGKSSLASLLLVSSFDFIASCRPNAETARLSAASSGDWIYVRDWVKELSNQLLGRIVNGLGGHGHMFTMGIPMAVTDSALQIEISVRGFAPLRFVRGRHEVRLWFSHTLPRALEAALGASSQKPALMEGSVLLLNDSMPLRTCPSAPQRVPR